VRTSADLFDLCRTIQEKCIRKGDFILASGLPAKYYYDGKQVTLRARTAKAIGEIVLSILREYDVEAVGGMAIGADPIAQSVALASLEDGGPEIPAFIVRQADKDHGTRERASSGFTDDGQPLLRPSRRVAIVDDIITTGGSVKGAIDVAKALGCQVAVVVVLVERHEAGGAKLERDGYHFRRLFHTNEEGDLSVDEELLRRTAGLSGEPVLR